MSGRLLILHPLTLPSLRREPDRRHPSGECFRRPSLAVRCCDRRTDPPPRWERALSAAASLYPVYVTVGAAVACVNPSAFQWFVRRGPTSYSLALSSIMLAMGVTLEFRELVSIFVRRPLSVIKRLLFARLGSPSP